MTAEKRFIGFDLGAESGRCIVATLRDGLLTLDEVHRFTTHNVRYGGGFHWDVLAIVEEIVEGLAKAGKAFGPRFDGIGVDTWGVDYVIVDADGRVLGYPYHYRDSRTDGMMAKAFGIVPKKELYAAAGIQFQQFNTVFQLLAESGRTLNLLDLGGTVLLMPDYLNYILSGARKAEFTIASTTGLADPRTRGWSWDLVDRFGFPRSIFPPPCRARDAPGHSPPLARLCLGDRSRHGSLRKHRARHRLRRRLCPRFQGGSWAFLSSGTWSLMGVEIKAPLLTDEAMKCNFTNEGGIRGTTRFLKNIIGLWPVQECRRYWMENGNEFTYARLAELARAEGPVECLGRSE